MPKDWAALRQMVAALRSVSLGREPWLSAGRNRSGTRPVDVDTLIITAKMHNVDPLSWLDDFPRHIVSQPDHEVSDPLA